MIRKPATQQSQETVLESQPLQALVTDLPEDKEGTIVGGQSSPGLTIWSGVARETSLSLRMLIELIYF